MEQSVLLAHGGTRKLNREELTAIPAPEGSLTHRPIPHHEIVSALIETLSFRQIGIVRDEFAVSGDGMKMFGVLDLETTFEGCRFSIGLRNANDKSMRLALTIGYRVFVCDNMAFHGDFTPVLAKALETLQPGGRARRGRGPHAAELRADTPAGRRMARGSTHRRPSQAHHLPGVRGSGI